MPLPPSYLDAEDSRALTRDEAKMLITFIMLVQERGDGIVASGELDLAIRSIDPAMASHFFVAVVTKKLAVMRPDLSFSVPLLIWCTQLSDRVGVAVHWAYTLMDFERRNNRPMTLKDWCLAFPLGPPTEKEMHRLWDRQKVERGDDSESDNRLDGREAWAALHAEMR